MSILKLWALCHTFRKLLFVFFILLENFFILVLSVSIDILVFCVIFFTPYPVSHLRHNTFSLDDQQTGLEAGLVGEFEKSRIQISARRPTVMRLQLFYSVTPGSCWYSTVKWAVPPIRGKGSRYKLPGPCGLPQSPGS